MLVAVELNMFSAKLGLDRVIANTELVLLYKSFRIQASQYLKQGTHFQTHWYIYYRKQEN